MTQQEIEALKAECDAWAAKAALLNGLLEEMQERASKFLQPDGGSGNDFINFILEALDGPKQRVAQTPTSGQHIVEIRAEAGRAGFIAGAAEASNCLEEHAECIYKDEANQYAELVRQGSA